MSRSVFTRIARGLSRRAAARLDARVMRMRNDRPIVSITFDDCPRSAVTVGAAILEAQRAHASFYLAGGLAGCAWENGQQFELPDVRRLLVAGHEVGCHTYSHPDCAVLGAAAIVAQLDANRGFFARTVPGLAPATFAYPYGSVSLTAKRTLHGRFRACRGVERGLNAGIVDLEMLKAVAIPAAGDDGAWIEPWLDQAKQHNGWLVLYTHDVEPAPTPFGCTPGMLANTVAAIRAAGIEILTVAQAAQVVAGDAPSP